MNLSAWLLLPNFEGISELFGLGARPSVQTKSFSLTRIGQIVAT